MRFYRESDDKSINDNNSSLRFADYNTNTSFGIKFRLMERTRNEDKFL